MPRENSIPIPIPVLGLLAAVDREHVPAEGLTECENFILRDRDFRVRNGLTLFGNSLGARPTGFVHYDHTDGSLKLVGATITGWKFFNFVTHTWTTITGSALTTSTEQQVFRVFQKSGGTHLLGVNNKDTPKKWDGVAAGYSNIGGSPPIARCMMILNNHVILGNLKSGSVISPVATDVSAFNDFDTGWGSIQVALHADTNGEIVIMQEMGNLNGAIIKTDAIHRATAQGGGADPFRFDYVAVPKDEGAAATLAYVVLGDGSIVYLALNGKLKRFDGVGVTDFGGDNARVFLSETLDFSSIGRSWMAYDSTYREILIVYPQRGGSGEPDKGLIVKEQTGAILPLKWGTRKFTAGGYIRSISPLTLGDLKVPLGSITKTLGELGQGNIVRSIIVGETTAQAYTFTGESDNGTPIDFVAETGLAPLGGGANYATVNSIEHRFQQVPVSQQLSVKIGSSKSGETRTLSSADTIDIGTPGPYYTGHRVTSKYLSMRFEGSALRPVIWRGSYVDSAPRGRWR